MIPFVTLTLDFGGSVDLTAGGYHFDYLPQVLPNPDRVDWTMQVSGARVVAATGQGAVPVVIDRRTRSASVARSGDRGPWSADIRLRR
jgi:hypothetical protein